MRFLKRSFPSFFNIASSAEYNLHQDPVTTLFKLRQFTEKVTDYMSETHHLEPPAENTFHNRVRALEDERILQPNIAGLVHNIKRQGNQAVHRNTGSKEDAKSILFSTFKVAKWFYQTYSDTNTDISQLKFSSPREFEATTTLQALEKEYAELEQKFKALLVQREAETLSTEQVTEIRQRAERSARNIDLNEAETRERIDAQLQLAGWEVNSTELNYKINKTLPERGRNMAIAEWHAGKNWADYALFVGTQLYGIVEAKKWGQDISTNLRQAKVYAEQVSTDNDTELLGVWNEYRVPFLFSTNGRPYLEQIKTKSGIWFLDARNRDNISRSLQAWYSPQGLVDLFNKDAEASNNQLARDSKDFLTSDSGLGLREYQIQAIDKVEEAIIQDNDRRRALLAMATGTGKTRTIIGLCYRLIKSNRFKRILFLVDRTALGIQAINAFNDNKVDDLNTFAEIYQVEAMKTAIPDMDTRLHFATVQSMVKRLYYKDDEEPGTIPTVDTYDCIIVDEAHRGYLIDRQLDDEDLEFRDQQDYVSKYRMVLDYFDAFAIGLTATPALHTVEIFGKPVFNYSYREAVIDGFLVDHEPPYLIRTKLSEEGIVWEKGERPTVYDSETNTVKELDELEDELKIEVEHFNKLVITENFNRTVISQLVKHLDPEGEEKTLVFAASNDHADLIVQLFKEEFRKIGVEARDNAIAKVTGKSYDPLELIKRYKNEKNPNIAVTVDLLTTGIDVPAITNLIFMRRVKSRILYEQMLGRATRLCPEIGKEAFKIFDAVRIYEALEEFTNMKPVIQNPKTTFEELVDEIDAIRSDDRLRKQVEQIIAKLQRKKSKITSEADDKFRYASGGMDVADYIDMLRNLPPKTAVQEIMKASELWKFLDEFKPTPEYRFVSDHADEPLQPDRGYGRAKRPEDYIENFRRYIDENRNRITALNLICSRPAALDRKSLKELYLQLDHEGFTDLNLRHAWKAVKNEDIAADIISFIRTLSLGSDLVDHEVRIKNAMDRIRGMRDWNKVQQKWLARFEAQLIHESILKKEDLDQSPFKEEGGFKRLNRIFEEKLEEVLDTINENLYKDAG